MNNTICKDQLEMVMIVFKIRKIRLLQYAPLKTIRIFKKIKLFDIIEEKLQSIPRYDEEQQQFYIDAFYQMSRIWEGYSKDKYGNIRFQFNQKRFLKDSIIKHFNYYVDLFKHPIYLEDFDNEKLLQNAFSNLLKNIKILQYIYQQQVSKDLIERFMKQTKFIFFKDFTIGYHGFCSVNSRRIYIKSTAYQYIVEAIIVESLYYFLRENQDPLLILSEGQNQLYIIKDLLEPGDYYNKMAHNMSIYFPSPFKMQLVLIGSFF